MVCRTPRHRTPGITCLIGVLDLLKSSARGTARYCTSACASGTPDGSIVYDHVRSAAVALPVLSPATVGQRRIDFTAARAATLTTAPGLVEQAPRLDKIADVCPELLGRSGICAEELDDAAGCSLSLAKLALPSPLKSCRGDDHPGTCELQATPRDDQPYAKAALGGRVSAKSFGTRAGARSRSSCAALRDKWFRDRSLSSFIGRFPQPKVESLLEAASRKGRGRHRAPPWCCRSRRPCAGP